jgi:hypothetical protein
MIFDLAAGAQLPQNVTDHVPAHARTFRFDIRDSEGFQPPQSQLPPSG